MKDAQNILALLETQATKTLFGELYGKAECAAQAARYKRLLSGAMEAYGDGDWSFVSSPGRTELAGNHTDHNHGQVLAGSVQLDAVACVKPSDDRIIELISEGFDTPFRIDLSSLDPVKGEEGKTESLLRGIAAAFSKRGYAIGGFKGEMNSTVLQGSGLSSSASVEVLFGTIFSHLFNKGQISWVETAQIGQWAENRYFGKPCGLMDQMACASGGVISIDFANPEKPEYKRIKADFDRHGYSLLVVNTGGNHADLTPDYAAIPSEMKSIAREFGKNTLRGVTAGDLMEKTAELRKKTSDRAILRAMHFVAENDRVPEMANALKMEKIETYLKLVKKSGNSSWKLLQNVFTAQNPTEQGITLALALSSQYLGKSGVSRVHGGGFAGTIQAYVPSQYRDEYISFMEQSFGPGSVTVLSIRPHGAIKVL